MNILHLDSSPSTLHSASRHLTQIMVEHVLSLHPVARVTRRDLTATALPHLTGALYDFVRSQGTEALAESADAALPDRLLAEFMAADIVIIGAPMYNFSVPTQLKAWIDRVVIPGRTFRFTEAGPVGLCHGKQMFVASSRGSAYAGTPYESFVDHQEAYLRAIFSFVGITDFHVIRAEGLQMPGSDRHQALLDATRSARTIMSDAMLGRDVANAQLAAAGSA